MQTGRAIHGFASHEVKKLSAGLREILSRAVHVETQILHHRQRLYRRHRVGQSGRHRLDRDRVIEVFSSKSDCLGYCFARMHGSEDWTHLGHLSKRRRSGAILETYRDRSHVQVQLHFVCACLSPQRKSRAQRGMPGERQFFLHGEDSDTHATLGLHGWVTHFCVTRGRIPGQNESRLRKIHLFRDRLHLGVAQPATVEKYCQRIPFEWPRRKNVPLRHSQSPHLSAHQIAPLGIVFRLRVLCGLGRADRRNVAEGAQLRLVKVLLQELLWKKMKT